MFTKKNNMFKLIYKVNFFASLRETIEARNKKEKNKKEKNKNGREIKEEICQKTK